MAQLLRDRGYDAYALKGGVGAWLDERLPTEPKHYTIEGCGRTLKCQSGGYSAEWDDGRCDMACTGATLDFERSVPTPLAQGSRRLARLTVSHMRRGAVRQLLGGAVSEAPQDQEFLDLTLTNVTVAEVIARLEQ